LTGSRNLCPRPKGTREVAVVSSRQFLKYQDSNLGTREITDIYQGEEEGVMSMKIRKKTKREKEQKSPSLVRDFLFGHADKVTNFILSFNNQSCHCIQAFSSWQTTVLFFLLLS
jgi:hypothetical protein